MARAATEEEFFSAVKSAIERGATIDEIGEMVKNPPLVPKWLNKTNFPHPIVANKIIQNLNKLHKK